MKEWLLSPTVWLVQASPGVQWHPVTFSAADSVLAMIAIRGSIQTRRYQDKDGNNRTAFDVVADDVQFADFGKKEDKPSVDVDPENDPLPQFADSLSSFQEVDPDDDCPF